MSVSVRRILISLFWVAVFMVAAHAGFAQEAVDSAEKGETVSSLATDIKKARDIILEGTGGNPFGRGMMVAFFEPVFLASMFCLGLWSGQMSERISAIWALPLIVFGATVVGAFITAYHVDWKPNFDESNKILSLFNSTEAVAVVVGVLAGTAVGMRLIVAPFFAILIAVGGGLALGFSQIGEIGDHTNSLMPFWAGFALSGLLVNIFGIGFETFLESIKLDVVTRWVGFATLALSVVFGTQIF